jgi:DnaJ-class molecular chaperone
VIVSAAKASEAAGVLEVELSGLTSSMVRRAYRQKAKDCHPDHHGTSKLQEWSRVSWAKEVLMCWVEKHPSEQPVYEVAQRGDCRACEGTGRVKVVQRGFGKPLTMACVICKGLGTVILEEQSDG